MNIRRPSLSLLIPAYNAAWCLPRLLASAHKQTCPFDEIWVYDDCSTDDTAAVAERYGAKVLRGTVNVGCSVGKNVLARHVKTDWVHFHDADDELLPNFVELAHKWIEKDEVDVVLFAYEYRDNETGELLAINRFDDTELRADPRRYAIVRQINPFCGLYRRARIVASGGYDEDPQVLYNEDVAFHIRIAFAGLTFAAEGEVSIINYRVRKSMSAANGARCVLAQFEVMRKCLNISGSSIYHKEIGQSLWNIAAQTAVYDKWDTVKASAELAAKLAPPSPTSGRAWFRIVAQASPYMAIKLREFGIRMLKPHLRHKAKK